MSPRCGDFRGEVSPRSFLARCRSWPILFTKSAPMKTTPGQPNGRHTTVDNYRLAVGPLCVGLIQLAGGAVLGLGLWFTWLQYQLAREQHLHELIHRAVDELERSEFRRLAALHRLASIARTNAPLRESVVATAHEYERARSWPRLRCSRRDAVSIERSRPVPRPFRSRLVHRKRPDPVQC
jgi:hypothetical protein